MVAPAQAILRPLELLTRNAASWATKVAGGMSGGAAGGGATAAAGATTPPPAAGGSGAQGGEPTSFPTDVGCGCIFV